MGEPRWRADPRSQGRSKGEEGDGPPKGRGGSVHEKTTRIISGSSLFQVFGIVPA